MRGVERRLAGDRPLSDDDRLFIDVVKKEQNVTLHKVRAAARKLSFNFRSALWDAPEGLLSKLESLVFQPSFKVYSLPAYISADGRLIARVEEELDGSLVRIPPTTETDWCLDGEMSRIYKKMLLSIDQLKSSTGGSYEIAKTLDRYMQMKHSPPPSRGTSGVYVWAEPAFVGKFRKREDPFIQQYSAADARVSGAFFRQELMGELSNPAADKIIIEDVEKCLEGTQFSMRSLSGTVVGDMKPVFTRAPEPVQRTPIDSFRPYIKR